MGTEVGTRVPDDHHRVLPGLELNSQIVADVMTHGFRDNCAREPGSDKPRLQAFGQFQPPVPLVKELAVHNRQQYIRLGDISDLRPRKSDSPNQNISTRFSGRRR